MASAARVLVHDQVDVPAPVAELDVGEAVPLLGERAQALRQHVPLAHAQAELAAAAHEHLAVGRDHVAEVGVGEGGVRLLPELVERGVELEAPGPVGQVEEHRLAVAPAGGDPARQPPAASPVSAPASRLGEPLAHVRHGHTGGRPGGIRIDAGGPHRVDLGDAVGPDPVLGVAAHRDRICAGREDMAGYGYEAACSAPGNDGGSRRRQARPRRPTRPSRRPT